MSFCKEHQRLVPHFGCEESIRLVTERGDDPTIWSTPHIHHPFAASYMVFEQGPALGCTHKIVAYIENAPYSTVCGWPREAHIEETVADFRKELGL